MSAGVYIFWSLKKSNNSTHCAQLPQPLTPQTKQDSTGLKTVMLNVIKYDLALNSNNIHSSIYLFLISA